ncbi:hypothetical protein [Actinomadura madurae]|nr:hypothetical protein [Actinomadura madurae]
MRATRAIAAPAAVLAAVALLPACGPGPRRSSPSPTRTPSSSA